MWPQTHSIVLEMQILRARPRPPELETLGARAGNVLTKLLGDFDVLFVQI